MLEYLYRHQHHNRKRRATQTDEFKTEILGLMLGAMNKEDCETDFGFQAGAYLEDIWQTAWNEGFASGVKYGQKLGKQGKKTIQPEKQAEQPSLF